MDSYPWMKIRNPPVNGLGSYLLTWLSLDCYVFIFRDILESGGKQMLPVYQLSIPTPYPVGPVNIYLIKSRPYTLIDVGPDTLRAKNMVESGLRGLGVSLREIGRVMITHSHPDHCGLLNWIREYSGAELIMRDYECAKLTGAYDYLKDRVPLVLETGITSSAMEEIMGDRDKLSMSHIREEWVKVVEDGDSFSFEDGVLKVLHFPGHCPGHICPWDPEGGNFFAGDFLLPHITPNPLLEADPRNPSKRVPGLSQYLSGLDRLEQMDVSVVWPGHGGVFNDYRSVIEQGRRHHERQCSTIMGILEKRRFNAFELSQILYPNLRGWEIFLGISEIQAHLDLLVSQSKLWTKRQENIVYYHRQE